MKWLYRGLMAGGMILGGIVSGGILPVGWGLVATALTGAGAFFHDSPAQGGK